MKIKWNRCIKVLGFLGVLACCLVFLSFLFLPKNDTDEEGMKDLKSSSVVAEPENTIDVIVVGDSNSYDSFHPMYMWKQYGITSFDCGTAAQELCYTLPILRNIFKTQSPKVVVLETDCIFREFSVPYQIMYKVNEAVPAFAYHDRWKNLDLRDFNFTVGYTNISTTKGYEPSDLTDPGTAEGWMEETAQLEPVPSESVRYLKSIQQLCQKNGAKLLLVSAPNTVSWNYKKHNATQQLANELGLDFVDLNLCQDEVQIDWSTDTRDKGDHLNNDGAKKVSKYFGQYLLDHGLAADHRDDACAAEWDKCLQDYYTVSADLDQ